MFDRYHLPDTGQPLGGRMLGHLKPQQLPSAMANDQEGKQSFKRHRRHHAQVDRGDRIFLDLKYHDIPNTVAEAVRSAALLGVWMVNVHASGGMKMMAAARAAADQAADSRGSRPIVIAVTVLTSFDEDSYRATGVNRPIAAQVEALAAMAQDAGLDGVVASPHEIGIVRARCGPRFHIVTPGIRSGPTSPADDQSRTMSAGEAVRAGATYVVVGRPILRATDPAVAAAQLASSLSTIELGTKSNEL